MLYRHKRRLPRCELASIGRRVQGQKRVFDPRKGALWARTTKFYFKNAFYLTMKDAKTLYVCGEQAIFIDANRLQVNANYRAIN